MTSMKQVFAECLQKLEEAEGRPMVPVLGALSPEAWMQLFESAPMHLRKELHEAALRQYELERVKADLAKLPLAY